MALHKDWDPSPVKLPKQPALTIGPIHGVLPYQGARSPLALSSVSQKVIATFSTPADGYLRRLGCYESSIEYAVSIEALLSGQLHGLEMQLPPIQYRFRGTWKHHCFDLRLTCKNGKRLAVFVRNDESLRQQKTQDEIHAIFRHIPEGFCDQAIVVGSAHYTKVLRDNLRRIWAATQAPDGEADATVLEIAGSASYWDIEGLIEQCPTPRAKAWRATLRLVGAKLLDADWHAMIDYPSRIRLVP